MWRRLGRWGRRAIRSAAFEAMRVEPKSREVSCERLWSEEENEEGALDRSLLRSERNWSSWRCEREEAKAGRQDWSRRQSERFSCWRGVMKETAEERESVLWPNWLSERSRWMSGRRGRTGASTVTPNWKSLWLADRPSVHSKVPNESEECEKGMQRRDWDRPLKSRITSLRRSAQRSFMKTAVNPFSNNAPLNCNSDLLFHALDVILSMLLKHELSQEGVGNQKNVLEDQPEPRRGESSRTRKEKKIQLHASSLDGRYPSELQEAANKRQETNKETCQKEQNACWKKNWSQRGQRVFRWTVTLFVTVADDLS